MICLARRNRRSALFVLTTAAVLVVTLFLPQLAAAQAQTEDVYGKFREVTDLKAQGEYDRAIEKVRQIIEEYSDAEDVLKRAYNELVSIHVDRQDDPEAVAAAGQALERFPDLSADPLLFQPRVNEIYDRLRGEMFGSLVIQKPEDCRVFLRTPEAEDGGKHVGETPLTLDYVRVGEYDLIVTKSGYHDYTERIVIQPSGTLNQSVSLERRKDKRWWLYRVGAGAVAAVGVVAIVLSGGTDEPPPPAEPLPGPPAPPTSK